MTILKSYETSEGEVALEQQAPKLYVVRGMTFMGKRWQEPCVSKSYATAFYTRMVRQLKDGTHLRTW